MQVPRARREHKETRENLESQDLTERMEPTGKTVDRVYLESKETKVSNCCIDIFILFIHLDSIIL